MRCYDGCPDSELQALLDDQSKAHAELAAIGARATYFPMEGKWMAFKGNTPITEFCDSVREAANVAINS